MQKTDGIVITGAAGFIASVLVESLNQEGYEHLFLVDDFSILSKQQNFIQKKYKQQINRDQFVSWFEKNHQQVSYVFHLGARTDTTEMDYNVHQKWNVAYSQALWKICTAHKIPLIYASSAATYGDGSLGYKDTHEIVSQLKPLNPYGLSKNNFDLWALAQKDAPPFWAGLKFFNVYGPNEYHKGRMASVIFHSFHQIKTNGFVKLFKSHKPEYQDGGQLRDFVYVKDIVSICKWLMQHQPASGLYNAGTGKAQSFLELAQAVFKSLNLVPQIEFIDTPLDIRDKYQYFTEADMSKLIAAGYPYSFMNLEQGVADYVQNYLVNARYF